MINAIISIIILSSSIVFKGSNHINYHYIVGESLLKRHRYGLISDISSKTMRKTQNK